MKTKQLTQKILDGDFSYAKQLVADIDLAALEELLLEIAYKTESEAVYLFVYDMLKSSESVELHTIAATLMNNPLCFLPDGYAKGLYHIRKALELDSTSVALMELMLFYNLIPDELVAKEEAMEYARRILLIEPDNKKAIAFLE